MIIAFFFMIGLNVLDWILKIVVPGHLFFMQTMVDNAFLALLSLLPSHPLIPYNALGLALVAVMITSIGTMIYGAVRAFATMALRIQSR